MNKTHRNQKNDFKGDFSDENENMVGMYRFCDSRSLKTIFDGFVIGFITKDDDEN